MSAGDKMKAAAEQAAGRVKEGIGKVTDNEKLEAEGKLEQAKGKAREAAEDVKDTFKK